MKFVKTLFIALEILLVFGQGISQSTAIGFRAGASYFTVNNDEINDAAKYTMGTDFSLPVEVSISKVFSIQPELHYIQKGVEFEEKIDGQIHSLAAKTRMLELPVLLKANYGGQRARCYAFIAPSVGYAMKQFTVEKIGDGDKSKSDVDFVDTEDIKSQRWEFSAVGGIGASFKAGVGSFVIDARYSFGLTDNTKFKTSKPDDWSKTTNRGCTLSVGYMIPIGGY